MALAARTPVDLGINIDTHAIEVTIFPNQYARRQTRLTLTLPAIAEKIRTAVGDRKEELPFLKIARFGNTKNRNNCLRYDDNCRSVNGTEHDYDGEIVSFEEGLRRLRASGMRGIICTTASNTPEKPRWRLYLPFSKELVPPSGAHDPVAWLREERRKIVKKVNHAFGGIFASESEKLSLSFYFGNIVGREPIRVEVVDGEFADIAMRDVELPADAANPFSNYAPPVNLRSATGGPLDEDAVLAAMEKGTVNETLTRVAASLVSKGWTDDEIVDRLLPESRRVWADDWTSDEKEDGIIRRMCASARKKYGFDEQPERQRVTPADEWADPMDWWGSFDPPELPHGVLPPEIEAFAFNEGELMGADPAGLAMAALCACAVVISDDILLRPKLHDQGWMESARLWGGLIGEPSTKKTPIINRAIAPIRDIDSQLYQEYTRALIAHQASEDETAPEPVHRRLRLEDTTIEAAQEVLRYNSNGILVLRDELSGFFGALERYSGGKAGASGDRAFWLQAYNGGEYLVNRIQRGAIFIPNLSASILGGIQPDLIRKMSDNVPDDGLLQRFNPIVLRRGALQKDIAFHHDADYPRLIQALFDLQMAPDFLRFTPAAQAIWNASVLRHYELQSWEKINRKFAAHVQKYDGMFARLCVIFHCIKHARDRQLPIHVEEETVARVDKFMHGFLMPHALCFYQGMLGLSDDHDRLQSVAGYILAHRLDVVTNRDIARGVRAMRKLQDKDTRAIFEQLEALGWLQRRPGRRPTDPLQWAVNPRCHELFQQRADQERAERAQTQATLRESLRSRP